jgi:phosphatidylglycerol:prolipoprotein diacylglycerol transferase
MGCTTAHDHPGCPSQFWLAVRFPDGPRHDLGFYEFLLCFLWLPLVYWLGRKKKVDDPPRGTLMHAMLVAYAVPRFFLDFLRAYDLAYRDVRYAGLTPAQYGCIFFTIVGIRFLLKNRPRPAA